MSFSDTPLFAAYILSTLGQLIDFNYILVFLYTIQIN